jgi:magnesium-transporting ATPase (P-type)
MQTTLRILLLEDNPLDAELIEETLRSDGVECKTERVDTREGFKAALEKCGFDLVFADYSLPTFDGMAALAITRRMRPDLPFIIISGRIGEEIAIEALKSGATDYVLKNNLSRLAPETEFERGTKQFGLLITRVIIFLVLFAFLVNAALRRDPFESLLFSIALAVGLTPEFLPMISAVTLGQGALRMARLKVIVKHLAAIQNFGSIDILCSDKTGTLTSGEMSLDQHLDPLGKASERPCSSS